MLCSQLQPKLPPGSVRHDRNETTMTYELQCKTGDGDVIQMKEERCGAHYLVHSWFQQGKNAVR